jgi:hypothetical protein
MAGAALAPAAHADPSAWPFKQAGDSGVLSYYENADYGGNAYPTYQFPDPPWYVQGFDTCVWANADNNADMSYPEYQINGCVPVASPWIWVKAISYSSWAIYCPASAPYNYAALPIDALQFWFGDSDVEGTTIFTENYNPGSSDHSVFNHDLSSGHHWKFIIGCSPVDQGSSNTPYSNGVGPSGMPSPCCGIFAPGGGTGPGARPVKLSAARIDRSAGGYTQTREFDLPRTARRTYTVGCRAGERLGRSDWGIGWFTARRPKRGDGSADGRRVRSARNTLAVRVTTKNARSGAARLQTRIRCLG